MSGSLVTFLPRFTQYDNVHLVGFTYDEIFVSIEGDELVFADFLDYIGLALQSDAVICIGWVFKIGFHLLHVGNK